MDDQAIKQGASYSGLFIVNKDELLRLFPPKHKKIFAHHSTIEFKPRNINNIAVGKKYEIKILGRATDNKGDALLVENPKSKNKYPHITVSCAEGIPPMYSNELLERAAQNDSIIYFDKPVSISVIEGYVDNSNKLIIN